MDKNSAREEDRQFLDRNKRAFAISYRMVVKGLTEKVTYGQKHKAGEKVNHVAI